MGCADPELMNWRQNLRGSQNLLEGVASPSQPGWEVPGEPDGSGVRAKSRLPR
jgi:hypothetical protein